MPYPRPYAVSAPEDGVGGRLDRQVAVMTGISAGQPGRPKTVQPEDFIEERVSVREKHFLRVVLSTIQTIRKFCAWGWT